MNYLLSIIVVFVIILISMMLHELAHGYTAYLLGDDTAKDEGRLTLNPFKHLDPLLSIIMPLLLFISGGPVLGGAKPVPVDSRKLKHGVWGMALVALAGPLTNLLLAFVAFLIGHFTGAFVNGHQSFFWSQVLMQFVGVNLGFAVFNLIPIPPLDGSRLLYAIAPDQVRRGMSGMERYGIFIVLVLLVLFPNVIYGVVNGAMNGIMDVFYFLVGAR